VVEEECLEPENGEVHVKVPAAGISGIETGRIVAALPISGA
jgi:hypothetical protein